MKFCKDCDASSSAHIEIWLNELIERYFPKFPLPRTFELFFNRWSEKIFLFLGLISLKDDFLSSDIQLRSACFIQEAKKRGICFSIISGPQGYTNHFLARIQGKTIRFEGLPTADFKSRYGSRLVDCKNETKKHLKKGNFPVCEGGSFWFFQKKQACVYGIQKIGFPLVVKPEGGSISRHVTTNIQTEKELIGAIRRSCEYSPVFLIEKYMEDTALYRATVVDMKFVACVRQIPAHVRGDGYSTIEELIEEKNKSQRRGSPHQKDVTLYVLGMDNMSREILKEQGYTPESVSPLGSLVYLQKNPFLKLGADLCDATEEMHPDNKKLFLDVAQFFDIRLVGIDILIPDIAQSWKEQKSAILELNNLPCIEMHHFPSIGLSQNVAKEVVDLFFTYYV